MAKAPSRFANLRNIGLRAARIYDEEDNPARVDALTASLRTIPPITASVADGNVYISTRIVDGLTADAFVRSLIQVPAGITLRLSAQTSAGATVETRAYEDPTWSDVGTEDPPTNLNRGSPNTSQVTLTRSPTLSDLGTEIVPFLVPGGNGGNAPGGSSDQAEMILVGPRNYAFEVKNVSASPISINGVLIWIEVKT